MCGLTADPLRNGRVVMKKDNTMKRNRLDSFKYNVSKILGVVIAIDREAPFELVKKRLVTTNTQTK